jgi:hypothetical protein
MEGIAEILSRIKSLTLVVAVALLMTSIWIATPEEAVAASKNTSAHKAFKTMICNTYSEGDIGGYRIRYKFIDLNGDKVDEMIVLKLFPEGYQAETKVYVINKGKVKNALPKLLEYYSKITKVNKSKKMFYLTGGWEGGSWEYICKVKKKNVTIVAQNGYGKCEINGKKVSKTKFNAYKNKVLKGAKSIKWSKLTKKVYRSWQKIMGKSDA